MQLIYLLAAVLAAMRMTEVITIDRIFRPIRVKFPATFWGCGRCVSIWAGALASVLWYFFPLGNLPFAIGWIYLVHNDWVRTLSPRQIKVELDNQNQVVAIHTDIAADQMVRVFSEIIGRQG